MVARMHYLLILLLLVGTPANAAPRNIATAPMGFYVDNAGNDSNDGLTRATAKQHFCVMARDAFENWDFRGFQPYIFPTAGQQFNEMCGFGGAPVGVDALIIAPDNPSNPNIPGLFINSAAAPFVRSCSPTSPVGPCGSTTSARQWCDNFGDLTILIYYSAIFYDCNHWNVADGASIIMHLTSTGDFFGSHMVISGSGNNDTGIYVDGPGIVTVGQGTLEFNGGFAYGIKCLKQCDASISGSMFFQYSNMIAPFYFGHGSHANVSTAYTVGAGAVFTGSSVVSGYSVVSGGTSPPSGPGLPAWDTPNNGLVCNPALLC